MISQPVLSKGGPPEDLVLPFEEFEKKFEKKYDSPQDRENHRQAYMKNLKEAERLNKKYNG